MKVLVCGSYKIGETNPYAHSKYISNEIIRASNQRKFVSRYLTQIHILRPITHVIGGNGCGAEEIGIQWARANNVPTKVCTRLCNGKSELLQSFKIAIGIQKIQKSNKESLKLRNIRMIVESKPDLVLVFDNTETTLVIVQGARARGLEVIEVEVPEFDTDILGPSS